jgi:GH15 family glucan-1,4-alpha-glucosidase
MQTRLIEQAWNEKRGAFTAAIGIEDLDASVLLLPEIGLLETHDPRFVRTVEAIERELLRDKHVMRCATSTLCVMRARMTSAFRKRLFSSADSG